MSESGQDRKIFEPLSKEQWKSVPDMGDVFDDNFPEIDFSKPQWPESNLAYPKPELRAMPVDHLLLNMAKSLSLAELDWVTNYDWRLMQTIQTNMVVMAREIAARPGFNDENPDEDQYGQRLVAMDLEARDIFKGDYNPCTEYWMTTLATEKVIVKEFLRDGGWLGHGGFAKDVESVAKNGLMTSNGVAQTLLKEGLPEEELNKMRIGRFNKGSLTLHPDAYLISFAYRGSKQEEVYPAGVYVTGTNEEWVDSEVSYFVPTEEVVQSGLNLVMSDKLVDNEIYLTNQTNLTVNGKNNRYEDNQDDLRGLGLSGLYMGVMPDVWLKTKEVLKKSGYDDDWISEHVYVYEKGHKRFGKDSHVQTMIDEKDKLTVWLNTRNRDKTDIENIFGLEITGNSYKPEYYVYKILNDR